MDLRSWELGVRRFGLTLLFASAALGAHGQELGRISGKVTDAATGAPVRGVSVSVYDAQGYSIASGSTSRVTTRPPPGCRRAAQSTVMILQNPGAERVAGTAHFWEGSGAPLQSRSFTVGPKAVFTLNTATLPALSGRAGSITITHDAPYGALTGKAIAVEPATGMSFDSPLQWRIVR